MARDQSDDTPWTEAETEYLLARRSSESYTQIGAALGKTRSAVGGKVRRLGLTKISGDETVRRCNAAKAVNGTRKPEAKCKPSVSRVRLVAEKKPAVSTFLVRPLPVRSVAVDPTTPEALAAAALLASAYEAENRRECYRLQGVR